MILVGIDPHKHSHTLVAVDATTRRVIGEINVPARQAGHQRAAEWVAGFEGQVLVGVEDIRVYSTGIEQCLLTYGVAVVRVPPRATRLTRRVGRTRGKSDAIDAHAVAVAAPEYQDRPAVIPEPWRSDLAVLVGDRDALVAERTRACAQLRRLLHRIDPELAPPLRSLTSTVQITRLTDRLGPHHGLPGQIAAQTLQRISQLTTLIRARTTQLTRLVDTHAPQLLRIPGCGPISAARILHTVGDPTRFATPARLARYAGIAPIPASSGNTHRNRLDRSGNRQLNLAIHLTALTQARSHPPARTYLDRKRSDGKTFREALRCLKRHLINTIHRALRAGPDWHPSLT